MRTLSRIALRIEPSTDSHVHRILPCICSVQALRGGVCSCSRATGSVVRFRGNSVVARSFRSLIRQSDRSIPSLFGRFERFVLAAERAPPWLARRRRVILLLHTPKRDSHVDQVLSPKVAYGHTRFTIGSQSDVPNDMPNLNVEQSDELIAMVVHESANHIAFFLHLACRF